MNILQGIQLHELILMILGFILGLALIFIFIYTSLKSKPNLKLLYGFAAPLVMIGYPSIRSVEFGKDVIKIDKLVEKVNQNPTDTVAQRELVNNLQELPASRCKTSSDALATIANAQASLGLYDSARIMAQRAVALDSKNEKAIESMNDITQKWQNQKITERRVEQLNRYIEAWEKTPTDTRLRDSIVVQYENLQRVSTPVHLDNKKILVVAQAASIVGTPQQAEQLTNEILKVNPNANEAQKMKEDIQKKRTDTRDKVKDKSKTRPSNTKIDTSVRKKMDPPKADAFPAPAPVYQDTPRLNIRLIPRSAIEVKKWNPKG